MSRGSRRPTLDLLLILAVGGAQAISFYDVIQLVRPGKPNPEIIGLIQATPARSSLDARSVIRLKTTGIVQDHSDDHPNWITRRGGGVRYSSSSRWWRESDMTPAELQQRSRG